MRKYFVPILITSLSGLHLWSLLRFPAPFVDEAWLASRAWGYLQTGRCFGPLDIGIFDYLKGYWTFLPCVPTWLQSVALRLAGTPSLLAIRLVSLFFGVILLLAVYWIGDLTGGRRLGILCLVIVGFSYAFFYSAHLARYDVIAATLGYLSMAIYLNERQKRRWWVGLLTGLLLGIAFEIHPNSAIFIPGLILVAVWDQRWGILRSAQFYGFITGGLLGMGLYIALHIIPFRQTYLEFNQYSFNVTHSPPLFTLNLSIILQSVAEMGSFLAVIMLLMFPVFIFGFIFLIKRRTSGDITLLILSSTLIADFILLVRLKPGYYAIYIAPILLIVAANYLLHIQDTPWSGHWADYLGRIAWGLVFVSFGLNLFMLRQNSYTSYAANQNRINSLAEIGDIVLGPQIYWFGLTSNKYLYMEQIAYYRHYHPQETLENALRHYHPSIFIEDNHLRGYVKGSTMDESSLFGYLSVSLPELERVLASHARLVAEFDGGYFGNTRVYRFDWDVASP